MIGVIPRYAGALVHDFWKACLTYTGCRHRLCGAHLLREPAFAVDSSDCRWARLMGTLPRGACHRVNASPTRTLTAPERRRIVKRYRTILTQGAREMPALSPRPRGRRGRIAKSDAHNLHNPHGRPVRHGESVLRFMADPDVSFTDNAGERRIRMAKARIRVSGCFRTQMPRRGLVQDPRPPQLHVRTRIQPTRRHPDRSRRKRHQHDQGARRLNRLHRGGGGGVSSYNNFS